MLSSVSNFSLSKNKGDKDIGYPGAGVCMCARAVGSLKEGQSAGREATGPYQPGPSRHQWRPRPRRMTSS